ncbi:hypothetical protein C9J85_01575 [Haloferax sp. wsp5]|nr:hypothetical protein C9J85_01575 [Haloferax sp. wsp5]
MRGTDLTPGRPRRRRFSDGLGDRPAYSTARPGGERCARRERGQRRTSDRGDVRSNRSRRRTAVRCCTRTPIGRIQRSRTRTARFCRTTTQQASSLPCRTALCTRLAGCPGTVIILRVERADRQLFPDEFDEEETLYDRQRIADIRAGDI